MILEPSAATIDDIFLTPQQLADRWQLDTGTLSNLRARGEGVPFVKLPSGSVRYKVADVLTAETASARGFSWARLSAALESAPGMTPEHSVKLLKHLKAAMDA